MPQEKKRSSMITVLIIMLLTLLGKGTGLIRDMLLGHNFATGVESTAFLTASRIPRNFFDAIFASAISASFIPVFNEYLEKRGKEEAFRLSNAFMGVVLLLTAGLAALGMVFAPQLTAFLADGFDAQTAALCTELLQILFPTVIFTGLAFSMVGILQSLGEFNIPAIISAVSNLVIIAYYLFFCEEHGIFGLAVAFLVGWAMQALVQVPALHKLGYRYRPALRHEGLGKIFKLMLPVMVSTWIQPINLAVSTKYASRLFGGAAASAMEYANTLYTIVVGVFVLSIVNVIFPEMSRQAVQQQGRAMARTIGTTLQAMLYFLIPMTVGLMLLAKPVIRLLYQWGNWDDFSTDITARALLFLALGMIGYGVQNVLSRAFYAKQNGKVPLVTGIVSVGLNLLLCQLLYRSMDVAGLALASSVSALVSGLLLLIPLRGELQDILDRSFRRDSGKMLLSAAVMALAVWGSRVGLQSLLSDGVTGRMLLVLLPVLAGVAVYLLLTYLLRVSVLDMGLTILKNRLRRGEKP